ncbi:hypothetical protein [Arthrobacter sp. B1805]|uniref:hypothetical protein n=1 Tax=Arthrobacter sp. B1805 TaxID=2058892 RepID=UPI000CE2DD8F|nr:hypothetical protein [Arthrobacter sp. B1805]
MLSAHLQQWSVVQAVRESGLGLDDILTAYIDLSGCAAHLDVQEYLDGLRMLPVRERDLLTQAVNELLDCADSAVAGAHYSDDDAAPFAAYVDHLPQLTLPEGYDDGISTVGDNHISNDEFL